MATIWARRRPIRDGARYSNEATARISQIPSRAAEKRSRRQQSQLKMIATNKIVEGAQKIAMRSSSGAGGTVIYCLDRAANVRNFLCEFRDVMLEPLRRGESEGAFEASGVGRPHLGIDDAWRSLAIERVKHLLRGYPAHVLPRFPGHPSGVGACDHIVELQHRMLR